MNSPDDESPGTTQDVVAAHRSDIIFPELDDQTWPLRLSWEASSGTIIMACGCPVPIKYGDTLWVLPFEDGVGFVPIALDPATIH